MSHRIEHIENKKHDETSVANDRAHRKDSFERAMEHDNKSRAQKKNHDREMTDAQVQILLNSIGHTGDLSRQKRKHDKEVQRIISEIPPPKVPKETHSIATGDDQGAIGEDDPHLWSKGLLSIGRLTTLLNTHNIEYPRDADKQILYNLVEHAGLFEGRSAQELHDEYFKTDPNKSRISGVSHRSQVFSDIRRRGEHKGEEGDDEHEGRGGKGEIHIGSGGIGVTNEGMNTSQIEDFLKNRTHHIIPCIAKDEMSTLLPYVHKGQKEFGFVFNTENHTQSGQHWKCCYINTETGECDYFDSLVSEPDKVFMKGITEIIKKIDPPIYLKLKINRVKIQSNTSANCGEFCCQFLDKMFHGGKFRQATFYDTINGEKNVDKYKSKWGLI